MARHFSPRPQGLPSRAPRELAVLVQLDLYGDQGGLAAWFSHLNRQFWK